MSGAEFLERYQGITDPVTAVDPARHYHVRQATQHPVKEHARVTRFGAGAVGGQLSGAINFLTAPVNLVGTGREARTENRRML